MYEIVAVVASTPVDESPLAIAIFGAVGLGFWIFNRLRDDKHEIKMKELEIEEKKK